MKTLRLLKSLTLICTMLLTTGCYEELNSSSNAAITLPYLDATDFLGIDKISNLSTGLSISWVLANPLKNVSGYHVYRYEQNKQTLIATVAPNIDSYIDGNVVSGTKYSYLVRAVDPSNSEDRNTLKKSGIFWEGLLSVTSPNQSKIHVTFSSQLKGYILKLYLQGEGRPKDTAIASITTDEAFSLGYYDITKWSDNTSLKPGATYQVSAEIFEANNQLLSDGNQTVYTVSTLSYGFHMISGQKQGWNNVATVRAFGESPLSDLISTAVATRETLNAFQTFVAPQVAQVEIGFVPFSLPAGLSANNYRYKIIRAPEGIIFNSSTLTAACPTTYDETPVSPAISSLQACIVAQNIHAVNDLENGLVVVRDQSAWDSIPNNANIDTTKKPPRYRYFMTMQHLNNPADIAQGSFTEEIPQADFAKFGVLIPIPPANMTLVNREAANYEFCKVQQSKPTDPLKNNRCEHFEVGADTYNSGPGNSFLNLATGFYDFGYNLFVDRYPLSCNNNVVAPETPTATTSLITAIATMGTPVDFTGAANAAAANDVVYSMLYGTSGSLNNGGMTNCRMYFNGAWQEISNFTTSLSANTTPSLTDAFKTTLTSAPRAVGTAKFNYPKWTQTSAQAACSSFDGSGYGLKRIPRVREFRAFTAPPFEINIDGKNIKDFYAQAVNAATSKTESTWIEGSCMRSTVQSTALNTRVNAQFGAPQYPGSAAGIFQAGNVSKVGVQSNNNTMTFLLGSANDALCMSKYGINGVIETAATYSGGGSVTNPFINTQYTSRYPTSDLFSWNPAVQGSLTGSLTGLLNNQDQGNNDLSLNIVGVSTGYFVGMPTGTTRFTTSSFSSSLRIDQALGLPATSSDPLNLSNYTPSISTAQNYGMTTIFASPSAGGVMSVSPNVSARYTTTFDDVVNRVRCVISAE